MSRTTLVVSVLVTIFCAHNAVAQTPFIHTLNGFGTSHPVGDGWEDIPSAVETITTDGGQAMLVWSVEGNIDSIGNGATGGRIRVVIGANTSQEYSCNPWTSNIGHYFGCSGSWNTTVEAGQTTVKLQAIDAGPGSNDLVVNHPNWTIVVFPDDSAGNVPAVSTLGLGAMLVLLMAAGAAVVARRRIQ